ncbi:mRNA 3'-end-processing protein rna14 [Stygiomarasmius scandens]|uniref:mRNA 3'-end-processing protein RNA14 n=1 Tax=Marasmiellus scandens TaxID=2682957 RepID=A0ABR1IMP6_9AGAR
MKTEIKKNDLTPTEFDLLRVHLQANIFDEDAWRRFLACAEGSGETEKMSAAYEFFLKQYPDTPSAQIAYINVFLHSTKIFPKAEELFKRFLKTSPSVELLRFYLTYIKRINTNSSNRGTLQKAYEFALGLVGQDRDSGDIWADYILFLDAMPTDTTWEKMCAIRSVYARAVRIPLNNLERLWRDYEVFETRIDPATAMDFVSDLYPAYNQAITVLHELNKQTSHLYLPALAGQSTSPVRSLPIPPKFIMNERQLAGRWRAYLKWEESNPLMIPEKDKKNLQSRINLAYQKAIAVMRFYPEIWFMAYTWTDSVGEVEEALSVLKSGIEANPASFLLNFAYIDCLEKKEDFEAVHEAFNKFLDILQRNLDDFQAKDGNAGAMGATLKPDVVEAGDLDKELKTSLSDSLLDATDSKDLEERKKEYGLVWIMYMRFGRRAEGVKSSRSIFGKARKARYVPWQIFEAAALMEYHCTGDKDVATKIFALGMNTYGKEEDFVVRYLSFLISQNDENNARALFESAVATFPPEQCRIIWERWSTYEYHYGNVEAARKLEKRAGEIDIGTFMAKKESQIVHMKEERKSALKATGSTSVSLKRQAEDRTTSESASNSTIAESVPRRGKDGGLENKRRRTSSPANGDSIGFRTGGAGPGKRWESFTTTEVNREKGLKTAKRTKNVNKPLQFPSALSLFIGQLPAPLDFDGPIFNPDDMMKLLKTIIIPSTPRVKPPPRSRGHHSAEYIPY